MKKIIKSWKNSNTKKFSNRYNDVFDDFSPFYAIIHGLIDTIAVYGFPVLGFSILLILMGLNPNILHGVNAFLFMMGVPHIIFNSNKWLKAMIKFHRRVNNE